MMCRCAMIVLLPLIIVACPAAADDATTPRAFFDRVIQLNDSFDEAVVELYADDARIRSLRRYPNGSERELEMDMAQFRALIEQFLPVAKQNDDRSEFSNIVVEDYGERATIRATRYSTRKCSTDSTYYMVIEKQADGDYLIVEEYSVTLPESNCEPAADIRAMVEMYASQVPVMADADTRLDAVTFAEPATLRFSYTLVSIARDDLDLERLDQAMREPLRSQSCSVPQFSMLLTKGAVLSYVYHDMNGVEVLTVEISEDQCHR